MATWAKGIDFKNSSNTTRIGGIGLYGNDNTTEKIYLGFGSEPWNNTGLQITTTGINYKGNKVYHAGDKPSASDIGAAPSSHNHDTLVTRNTIGVGFDRTKTGFQRPNGNGLSNGELVMHIAHPDFTGGQYSRGLAFKYGDNLGMYTYALSPDGNKITQARVYTEADRPYHWGTGNPSNTDGKPDGTIYFKYV